MRPDQRHHGPIRQAGRLADRGQQRTPDRPGIGERRQQRGIQVQHREQLLVPRPGPRIEQARRGRVRALRDDHAGQPVAEQVRHRQDASRDVERRRPPRGLELVERVERHVPGGRSGRTARAAGSVRARARPPAGFAGRDGGTGSRRAPRRRRAGPTSTPHVSMPMLRRSGADRAARRSPVRISWCSRRASQCRPSPSWTGSLEKRWTSSSDTPPVRDAAQDHAAAPGAQVDRGDDPLGGLGHRGSTAVTGHRCPSDTSRPPRSR